MAGLNRVEESQDRAVERIPVSVAEPVPGAALPRARRPAVGAVTRANESHAK